MPRSSTWSNSDSLRVGFGTHTVDNSIPAEVSLGGGIKQLSFVLDAAALIAAGTSWTAADGYYNSVIIPKGSRILSAHALVTVAFDALTAIVIGGWGVKPGDSTFTEVVDDADGFTTAAGMGLLTRWDTVGATVLFDGAYVNPASADGTNAAGVVGATSESGIVVQYVYTGSPPTVGSAQVLITYMEPQFAVPATI